MNITSSNIFDVGAKEWTRTVTYTLGGCRATFTLLLQIEFHFTEKGFGSPKPSYLTTSLSFLICFSMKCDLTKCFFSFVFPLFLVFSSWLFFFFRLVFQKSKRWSFFVKLFAVLLRSPDFSLLLVTLKAHFKIKCYSKVKSLCQE